MDAMFFANMETACALSQDASPLIGESVAVFGAGTVGALTAAVLAHYGHDVSVFDPRASRIAALQQRFPKLSCGEDKEFDICIEVSGATDALASAIQRCRRGGTVVLGLSPDLRVGQRASVLHPFVAILIHTLLRLLVRRVRGRSSAGSALPPLRDFPESLSGRDPWKGCPKCSSFGVHSSVR